MNTTLAEIVSKIASQGKNPDVSFLKDNPEAQTMLLMALLSSSQAQQVKNSQTNTTTTDNDKSRKSSGSISEMNSPSPAKTEAGEPSRKVGRKPVTSEEEDSDNPKLKRKAQNRAAQRAFRERKENHVRILEERVKELEELNSEKNTKLLLENEQLKEMVAQLQQENASLLSSSVGFDVPLSRHPDQDERPQKIIRSAASIASPIAPNFDSASSSCGYSTSSKSRSNTPESQANHKPLTIDDILGVDNTILPSNALLDHSELLGLHMDPKSDYSTQLDDILNQHRLTFATDPSQFDFFYPIQQIANHDILDTASLTLPPANSEPDTEVKDLTKVWDKLSEHPRFDEIDMDLLCDEMHKKATCKENHDQELEKLVNEIYPVKDEFLV